MRKTLVQVEVEGQDSVLCDTMLRVMHDKQKEKLDKARHLGRGGWQCCPPEALERLLAKAVTDNDYVSVANYAGMLYFHRAEY